MSNEQLIASEAIDAQVIELKSLHKVRKFKIQATKDKNGRYLGGVKNVDSNGDPILTREERDSGDYFLTIDDTIEVFDGMQLNLADDRDKKIWEMLKHSAFIADSREAADKSVTAEFYVHVPGLEATKTVVAKKKKYTAQNYIFNDSAEGLYKKARLLGTSLNNQQVSEVQEYLLDVAEKSPEKIISVYESPVMQTKLFLLDAIEKGEVSISNGVYTFNTAGTPITLGINENQAIEWLRDKENIELVALLRNTVYPEFTKKQTKTSSK